MAQYGRSYLKPRTLNRAPLAASAGLHTKVGSFACPSATGNFSVTGLGFQPKAILLWADDRTADGQESNGTVDHAAPLFFGMYDGTTNVALFNSDDFVSGGPAFDSTKLIRLWDFQNATSAERITGTGVSLDSGGFTVNLTAVSSGAIIHYLALGGSDITGAKIISLAPAAGNVSATGAGFQPDAAIFLGGYLGTTSAATPGRAGFGFASSTTQRGTMSSLYQTAIARYQRTDKAYVELKYLTGGIAFEADLVSFDSGGFTLNFSTASNEGVNSSVYGLCLKGATMKVGSIAQKTSTGTQATTGLGFKPSALLFATTGKTSGTTIDATRIEWQFGATDGTNRSVLGMGDATDIVGWMDRTKLYKQYADDATPTLSAAADISSLDADGFTLNYTTADATAREILFFAIGPAATGGGGTPGSKTQTAVARIQAVITKTQGAIARIQKSFATTQTAVARIAVTGTKTQSAVSRIAAVRTATQSAVARVSAVRTKTQSAVARVSASVSKTQTAIARIAKSGTKTQTAVSRIAIVGTKTQGAIARIAAVRTNTQAAISRIQSTLTKTQSGVSRIAVVATKTQAGVARVQATLTKTQSATAHISAAGQVTKSQTGTARISKAISSTQTAVARIRITASKTQTLVARIVVAGAKTQTAISRVQKGISKTQPATANIAARGSATLTGTGSLSASGFVTRSGAAALTGTGSLTASGFVANSATFDSATVIGRSVVTGVERYSHSSVYKYVWALREKFGEAVLSDSTGALVVQNSAEVYTDDAATVTGRAVISGHEAFTKHV